MKTLTFRDAQRAYDNAEPPDDDPACETCGDSGRVKCHRAPFLVCEGPCPEGAEVDYDCGNCTVPCPDCGGER